MADWLTARPVAHRGLHDAKAGIIENTASAFLAAIAGNYAIECDLQISADGEAMVYHDNALGRLTDGEAPINALPAADLKRVAFKSTKDRMLTLAELFDLVSGRVMLLLELKSQYSSDRRLPERVAKVVAGYPGPVAAMSFDPKQIAALRALAPCLRRGLTAQRPGSGERGGYAASYVGDVVAGRPQFLAYRVQDLTSLLPRFTRTILRLPVLTWTVRTESDRRFAARYADQIIFEGFLP